MVTKRKRQDHEKEQEKGRISARKEEQGKVMRGVKRARIASDKKTKKRNEVERCIGEEE
jgi:hypothetical protein